MKGHVLIRNATLLATSVWTQMKRTIFTLQVILNLPYQLKQIALQCLEISPPLLKNPVISLGYAA